MPRTRSSVPSASARAASAWIAHKRAAAFASSVVTSPPTAPVGDTVPSAIGICPATKARPPTTLTGTYDATGLGAAGSSIPSSSRRSSIIRSAYPGPDRRRGGVRALSGLEGLLGLSAQQLAALVLVQAAPDPVGLADPKGVFQARFEHGAGGADRLG